MDTLSYYQVLGGQSAGKVKKSKNEIIWWLNYLNNFYDKSGTFIYKNMTGE